MRLGLVSDLHIHAGELVAALAPFRDRRVDRVVTVGDTCDVFGRGDGTDVVAALLDG